MKYQVYAMNKDWLVNIIVYFYASALFRKEARIFRKVSRTFGFLRQEIDSMELKFRGMSKWSANRILIFLRTSCFSYTPHEEKGAGENSATPFRHG